MMSDKNGDDVGAISGASSSDGIGSSCFYENFLLLKRGNQGISKEIKTSSSMPSFISEITIIPMGNGGDCKNNTFSKKNKFPIHLTSLQNLESEGLPFCGTITLPKDGLQISGKHCNLLQIVVKDANDVVGKVFLCKIGSEPSEQQQQQQKDKNTIIRQKHYEVQRWKGVIARRRLKHGIQIKITNTASKNYKRRRRHSADESVKERKERRLKSERITCISGTIRIFFTFNQSASSTSLSPTTKGECDRDSLKENIEIIYEKEEFPYHPPKQDVDRGSGLFVMVVVDNKDKNSNINTTTTTTTNNTINNNSKEEEQDERTTTRNRMSTTLKTPSPLTTHRPIMGEEPSSSMMLLTSSHADYEMDDHRTIDDPFEKFTKWNEQFSNCR